jgi:dTDP-glucose pyrophosphorylase
MVMPMAGRGSRFVREGITQPKPLIELEGRPFFWWAAESVLRSASVGEMVFIVLQEHVDRFQIDLRIAEFYPSARVIAIPDVTSGAAETAKIGLEALRGDGPVAINDCDHAFICTDFAAIGNKLASAAGGALLCFRAESPAYSYVRLRADGGIAGTVEKRVVSPFAIGGCYMFSSVRLFVELYDEYRRACPYDELFISGLFDILARRGDAVLKVDARYYCPFGTPEERSLIDLSEFNRRFARE